MSCKIYIEDTGTEILVNTGIDISTATVVELHVKKPDSTEVVWTAVIFETNFIKYIAQPGDFNLAGKYLIQAYIVMPTWEGHGETASFQVYAKFN